MRGRKKNRTLIGRKLKELMAESSHWRRVRKFFFWLHLGVGLIAGAFLLIMALTGTLLSFEKRILAYSDREYSFPAHSEHAKRLPVGVLLAKVREQAASQPTSVTFRSDPNAPLLIETGRKNAYLADPYSGKVLGPASPKLRAFYVTLTEFHRFLGFSGQSRETMRVLKGFICLGLVLLGSTGILIWLPRAWTPQHLKPIVIPRWKGRSRARYWNWHSTAGFWLALPLVIIALSGSVMALPWMNALLFRIAGSPLPQAEPRSSKGGEATNQQRQNSSKAHMSGEAKEKTGAPYPDNLDLLAAVAGKQSTSWKNMLVRFPEKPSLTLTFLLDQGDGHPQYRDQATVSIAKGLVERWEPYAQQSRGRKWRLWSRFLHTGEALGWVGEAIVGIASLGCAVLAFTGFSLSWIRFRNWRRASRKQVMQNV